MSDTKPGTIGKNVKRSVGEAPSVAVNVEDIVNEIRAQLNGGGSVPTSGQVPARSDIRSIEKDDGEIELDIEQIMDQIREEASAEAASGFDIRGVMREIHQEANRRPAESMPDFSAAVDALPPLAPAPAAIPESVQNAGRDVVFRQISNEANCLKATSSVPFYWDMGRGIKGLAKRVVRRLSRPMLMPILERQNEFNFHTANGVDALRMGMDEHIRQIAALEGSPAIQILQQQVQKLNDTLAIHGEMIASQGETIASQSKELSIHGEAIASQSKELSVHGEAIAMQNEDIAVLNEDLSIYREEIARHGNAITAYSERLAAMDRDLTGHGDELAAHREELQSHDERLAAMDRDLTGHGDELAAHRVKLQIHDDRFEEQVRRMDGVDRAIDEISLSIARVIRHYLADDSDVPEARDAALDKDAESVIPSTEVSKSENAYESLDYFQFQNYFRGTQNQIMERQREYLPYFRNRTGKIFDLGCGRGEFLRLLKKENIPAFGVDTYPEYEITGQLYNVDIRVGDGLAALAQQQEPLGGIFCAQVIEHLGFKNVEKLCRLAYEKLEKGAYLVLETPNPMCVSTMTNGFYIDPTHDRPVHPLLMEYMLKSIGFTEVQLLWPDHSLGTLPPIHSEGIDNLEEVNRAIERVSNLLFGSQDYAVVAKR